MAHQTIREALYRKTGAIYQNGKCHFVVWAPHARQVRAYVSEKNIKLDLDPVDFGYFEGFSENIEPGDRYLFELDQSKLLPDPCSRYQPDGVHEASCVVNPDFPWSDLQWSGIPLENMIMYELHTGTFTPNGSFSAIVSKLSYLKDLGINTIEIMPVSQFPGDRNWGYDGVYPFAVQNSYGGPEELKKLINAAHNAGIAIVLDVVYNHLGPEGNYSSHFGPYFTGKYHTPWGDAINYDDSYCDPVRNLVLQNVRMWLDEFHLDGLRLDAIQAIQDQGAKHLLREVAELANQIAEETGSAKVLIGESDMNDERYIKPVKEDGIGLTGQWIDDIHHAIHAYMTGEREGYYADFGDFGSLKLALNETFAYDGGRYSVYRKKIYGKKIKDSGYSRFVIYNQNHDQIGNRMKGDRLTTMLSFEQLKLQAQLMLLSPYVPMLFMGEEYGEKQPFQYFISHSDEKLIRSVQRGRSREFSGFGWKGKIPDPQDEDTYKRSKLNWDTRQTEQNILLQYYQELLFLRKTYSAFSPSERDGANYIGEEPVLIMKRQQGKDKIIQILNISNEKVNTTTSYLNFDAIKIFDSEEVQWNGPGSDISEKLNSGDEISLKPFQAVIFSRRNTN